MHASGTSWNGVAERGTGLVVDGVTSVVLGFHIIVEHRWDFSLTTDSIGGNVRPGRHASSQVLELGIFLVIDADTSERFNWNRHASSTIWVSITKRSARFHLNNMSSVVIVSDIIRVTMWDLGLTTNSISSNERPGIHTIGQVNKLDMLSSWFLQLIESPFVIDFQSHGNVVQSLGTLS
jgi:hypothetical protein